MLLEEAKLFLLIDKGTCDLAGIIMFVLHPDYVKRALSPTYTSVTALVRNFLGERYDHIL